MQKNDFKNLTDERLQVFYANAKTTAALCNGHTKTEHNRQREKMALAEMDARGIEPDNRKGQFNGEGSF